MNVQLFVHVNSPRRGGAGRGARAAGRVPRVRCCRTWRVGRGLDPRLGSFSEPAMGRDLRASECKMHHYLECQNTFYPISAPRRRWRPAVPRPPRPSGPGRGRPGTGRARRVPGSSGVRGPARPRSVHGRSIACEVASLGRGAPTRHVASSISAPRRVQRNTARMLLSAIYVAHRRAMATPRPARGRDPRPSGTHERWAKRRGSAGASLTARD